MTSHATVDGHNRVPPSNAASEASVAGPPPSTTDVARKANNMLMDANGMELVPQVKDVCLQVLGRSSQEVKERVQVVSLGSYCATKLTLRRLGLSEASLPFDWMRTRAAGLIHWLQNDFATFFSIVRRLEVAQVGGQHQKMVLFRSEIHSFWHDDILNDQDREKLWRRVNRFLSISDSDTHRTLLFVRSIVGTDELELTETLYSLLKERFGKTGRKVVLLLLLDDQKGVYGPILHKQNDNILFWAQPHFEGTLSLDGEFPAPYEDAVSFAVARIFGDAKGFYPEGNPSDAAYPSVNDSKEILQPSGPFGKAGFKHTDCGLWAGDFLINGQVRELSAFEGYDDIKENHWESSYKAQPESNAPSSKEILSRPDHLGCKTPEPLLPLQNSLNGSLPWISTYDY